jgi:hypothetical protein
MDLLAMQNDGEKGFRYLGFFHDAAQKATARLSSIYGYARENLGPLKQGVYAMEGAVKFFVNPVYQKVEGKPLEILQFADKKVCRLPFPSNHETTIYFL